MTSDKAGAFLLSEIFVKKGLMHIVISPGSRNAPLIISFANNPAINAINIVDERSAAFFALGIAQQTKQTVAIACTSGSAALNYAPAIAEAYYQKIPLLIITADRPEEMVDHGDGQTIRQKDVYSNYIKYSCEITGELNSEAEIQNTIKEINQAIDLTQIPDYGPVHINIPFREPIYGKSQKVNIDFELPERDIFIPYIKEEQLKSFSDKWNKFYKILLIAGMMDPNPELKKVLKEITKDESVVLLTETTSNLNGDNCSCSCIDKVIHTIKDNEVEDFKPELLVTFGGHVVSKMVKAFIRSNNPVEHWHVDPVDISMNTYQCLTEGIQQSPEDFFSYLSEKSIKKESSYSRLWKERVERSENRHKKFFESIDYSDLQVFDLILNAIPEGSSLQLGNSTPVRYAQLFNLQKKWLVNSNRGTSGIDGTVSTAAGAAYVSNIPTTLITGDLGFLYDSNSLMNKYLSGNLRIIIINNGGGGIFRFIDGPDSTGHLEKFFEAHHNWNSKYIAKNFDVPYYTANDLKGLEQVLPKFYHSQRIDRPAILEIFTPGKKNAKVLKSYFNFLRE